MAHEGREGRVDNTLAPAMAPALLRALLDIYVLQEGHKSHSAVMLNELVELELIRPSTLGFHNFWLTAKGVAFLRLLIRTPLPTEIARSCFTDPRTGEEITQ